jgi:hypothetical protein
LECGSALLCQCFALPLWFLCFGSVFFALHKNIRETRKTKAAEQSTAALQKRKPEKGQVGGNSAVIFATPQ